MSTIILKLCVTGIISVMQLTDIFDCVFKQLVSLNMNIRYNEMTTENPTNVNKIIMLYILYLQCYLSLNP